MSTETAFVTEAELAAAVGLAHHLETNLLQSRIERLTAVIREHGLLLPDEDPRLGASDGDHLAACRRVVSAAYDLLESERELSTALSELRDLVGSGMELVGGERWASQKR